MSPSMQIVGAGSHIAAYFLYFLNLSHRWRYLINKEQASGTSCSMHLLKPPLYLLEYLTWSVRLCVMYL
jgi:hypothetical protein